MSKVYCIVMCLMGIIFQVTAGNHPSDSTKNYKHAANYIVGSSGNNSHKPTITTTDHTGNYKSSFNQEDYIKTDSSMIDTVPHNPIHPHNYKHQF